MDSCHAASNGAGKSCTGSDTASSISHFDKCIGSADGRDLTRSDGGYIHCLIAKNTSSNSLIAECCSKGSTGGADRRDFTAGSDGDHI